MSPELYAALMAGMPVAIATIGAVILHIIARRNQ